MSREELLAKNEMLISAFNICGCEKLRRLIVVTEIALLSGESCHPDILLEIEKS